LESKEIYGKIERKFFAIYFSPVFPAKFISLRHLKYIFKERLDKPNSQRKIAIQRRNLGITLFEIKGENL
jgi:hypothetical protein